jgi:poly(beta-D-mannuronate) lyase
LGYSSPGRRLSLPLLLAALTATACPFTRGMASEYRVSSAEAIGRLAGALQPGDVIVMADGTWNDQAIVFGGRGTDERPITLRAETPGKVILTGRSALAIDGEHLVVSGLSLKEGTATADGVKLAGRHCRLTDTAVVRGQYKFQVHMFGAENRLDHCYLAGKANDSPTLQIEVEGKPNHHRIDHNHFGPRPPLGRNGGETIRVGYSHQSMSESATLFEHNLFDRCDGEIEIISSKSCGNIYRFNTFLDCAGMLTLRHGNGCRVEGNFFLGHHKRGSGGIRVIGEDHVIINNYIEGVRQGGFWVTSGIPDSPLNGYYRARNILIAFNTVVDSQGPSIELDAGFGSSRRSLRPEQITIANNVFALPADGGVLLKGTEGAGYQWIGNIASPAAQGQEHPGIRRIDPRLVRSRDGLWRPAADSPARGAGAGRFEAVTIDIDGQARTGARDAGCDQVSAGPVTNRPLTAFDLGTSWMEWEKRVGGGDR